MYSYEVTKFYQDLNRMYIIFSGDFIFVKNLL